MKERKGTSMDPEQIRGLIRTGEVFDLGMEYYVGMPHHPNHPPFAFSLTKIHGDVVYEEGVSASNCMFATGGHTGTHFDAHGHISKDRKIFGVEDVGPWQDYRGLKKGGLEETSPVVARGVLFDVAGLEGVDCLDRDYEIGEEELIAAAKRQNISVEKGDVVLIRTGWIKHFSDPKEYVSFEEGSPGLVVSGARWLVGKGVSYVGSDTLALEKTPTASLPVHVFLLVENGIHIMEVVYLEELAEKGIYEFLFMVSPLKIRGGTGSPVRPIAIA